MLLYNLGGNAEDEVAGTGGTGRLGDCEELSIDDDIDDEVGIGGTERPDNCGIEGTGRLGGESDVIEEDGSCDVDCVDDCCCGIGGAGRLRELEDGTEGTGRLGG